MFLKLNLAIKRIFDIISAIALVIILLPVWVAVPIAIKKDSKGSVIFRQKRRTKNGKEFDMYKFRSMVVGAEQMGTGLFNYEGDPRVTRVGRILRDTSLDELPQLFNIIKGDMSVVGPRPCITYELGDFDTLNKRYRKRFEFKAGLTGLAQVNGRNCVTWDDRVGYDNEYIDKFREIGVLADVGVLFRTFRQVMKKEGVFEERIEGAMSDEESAEMAEQEIIRMAHLPD